MFSEFSNRRLAAWAMVMTCLLTLPATVLADGNETTKPDASPILPLKATTIEGAIGAMRYQSSNQGKTTMPLKAATVESALDGLKYGQDGGVKARQDIAELDNAIAELQAIIDSPS